MKKNYLIHDYIENFGGGERLALSISNLFDNFIVGFLEKKIEHLVDKNNLDIIDVSTAPILIKKILLIKKFKKYIFRNPKNILVSGNYSLFTNFQEAKNKIFYIHSLPKIIYDPIFFYKNNKPIGNTFLNFFYDYKNEYEKNIKYFDKLIVNSKKTQLMINKFIGLKSEIIYPPIFKKKNKEIIDAGFFFSNSRHEIEKNIDKIIKVFLKIKNKKIIISSSGSQTNKLKKLSNNNTNIKFVGNLTEKKYHEHLSKCTALINISKNEDFGMSALEGMVYGKPSFCLNDGGYLETTINGFNSFHIDKDNIEQSLFERIQNVSHKRIENMRDDCLNTASKYDINIFEKNIKNLLI